MLRVQAISLLLWTLLVFIGAADAYDLNVHSDISMYAFADSQLATYLSHELRINGDQQFDVASATLLGNKGTAAGWIREGAVREDDATSPGQLLPRFMNHFYNPLPGAPGDGGLWQPPYLGAPAPDWGINDAQDFSLRSARQYFYDALRFRYPTDREHQMALTFRAVGQLAHLIQDMAQPQHTRNDIHGPWWLGAGGRSLYERYTEDYHTALPLLGYPPVYGPDDQTTFSAPRRFWTHGGKGLADYSNRGFVSAGTNFTATPSSAALLLPQDIQPAPGFPLPSGNGAQIDFESIENLPNHPPNLHGGITFIETYVDDSYTGSGEWNERASTYSIFDPDLQAAGRQLTFTLNKYNVERAWGFLIPRAVGYSAGFISYFFRGRLDFLPDPDDASHFIIKNLGPEPMDGIFELFYDDAAANRHPVPEARWALGVDAGGQASVRAFSAPLDPPPNGIYTLVFRGQMGAEEAAVAVRVVDGSPFLLVTQTATYRSAFQDRGWQRVGNGIPFPHADDPRYCVDASNCSNVCGGIGCEGTRIRDDFLLLNGPYDYGYWMGPHGSVYTSNDNGRTFVDITETLYHSLGAIVQRAQFLGGTELLATYFDSECGPTYGYDPPLPCVPAGFSEPVDCCFASGAIGTLYSNDLGATWQKQPQAAFSFMDQLSYIGEHTVLATAEIQEADRWVGRRYRSTDHGLTFSPIDAVVDGIVADSWSLYHLTWNQRAGTERVILASSSSGMVKSTDGVHWRSLPALVGENFALSPAGVVLAHESNLADGSDSLFRHVIYKSLDAGETWQLGEVPADFMQSREINAGLLYAGDSAARP